MRARSTLLVSRCIDVLIASCLLICLPLNAAGFSYDSLFFSVESPEKLRFMYEISPSLSIGGAFPQTAKSRRMYYANPSDACSPLLNAQDIVDEVVLIERGECSFVDKALNAEAAGALIAIVTDSANASDTFLNMVQDDTHRRARIPMAFLPGVSGKRFRNFYTYEGESIKVKIPLNLTLQAYKDSVRTPPWMLQ